MAELFFYRFSGHEPVCCFSTSHFPSYHCWQHTVQNTKLSYHLSMATIDNTGFYNLLGVQKTSTPGEIKRAYYVKARVVHPDKNPDNPQAEAEVRPLAEEMSIVPPWEVGKVDFELGLVYLLFLALDLSNHQSFFSHSSKNCQRPTKYSLILRRRRSTTNMERSV